MHVREALAALPGVHAVDVFLTSEKAVLRYDPALVDLPAMRGAVAAAGYSAPDTSSPAEPAARIGLGDFQPALAEYQAQGHTVVMVGDGVNDAPAEAEVRPA